MVASGLAQAGALLFPPLHIPLKSAHWLCCTTQEAAPLLAAALSHSLLFIGLFDSPTALSQSQGELHTLKYIGLGKLTLASYCGESCTTFLGFKWENAFMYKSEFSWRASKPDAPGLGQCMGTRVKGMDNNQNPKRLGLVCCHGLLYIGSIIVDQAEQLQDKRT